MNEGSGGKMNKYDSLRSWKLARAAQAGVTLIEVLIVVAIMAMIAAGVTVAIFPKFQKAKTDAAESSARTVRQAAQLYRTTTTDAGCPSIRELIDSKQLDAAIDPKDPWGHDYRITCTADDVVVSSDGADGKSNTGDDIVVPKGASTSGS
jgi:general secretion pathway protein G